MEEIEIALEKAPEYKAEKLLEDLQTLNESAPELAKRLRFLGDHRPFKTVLRSIQRMLAGDVIISGEMRVIMNILMYQHRLREEKYKNLKWIEHENGHVSTIVEDYTITLLPQTKRRWIILITTKNGRNHPWPNWVSDLDSAKVAALKYLDDAIKLDFEEGIGLGYH